MSVRILNRYSGQGGEMGGSVGRRTRCADGGDGDTWTLRIAAVTLGAVWLLFVVVLLVAGGCAAGGDVGDAATGFSTVAGSSQVTATATTTVDGGDVPVVDDNTAQTSSRWTDADQTFLDDLGAVALGAQPGSVNAYTLVVYGFDMCTATADGSPNPAGSVDLGKWSDSGVVILTAAWLDLCPGVNDVGGE